MRPHKRERFWQLSVAARSDTVRHGVPCGGRGIPQSVCLERDAIHMAAGRVVDLRRRVCDSHWARTLSTSELASQNSTSRLSVCCAWGICSGCRGEHPRTNGRNRQSALARLGAHDLADHDRGASVCGGVGCSDWACPSATECQAKQYLIVWPKHRVGADGAVIIFLEGSEERTRRLNAGVRRPTGRTKRSSPARSRPSTALAGH